MNTLTRTTTLVVLLFVSGITAIAQPESNREEKREKIQAMKVGFITERLDLTTEEAQRFWPVYNAFEEKQRALRQSMKMEKRGQKPDLDNMSDEEVTALVDNHLVYRQKKLDLQKEYHAAFKSVLPIRKVAKLYHAERAFKRELLHKMKGNRPGHGGQGGPRHHDGHDH